MRNKYLFYIGLVLILGCNLILTFQLNWNPYDLYFDRPELSSINFKTREFLSNAARIGTLILLWTFFIWGIYKYYRYHKLNIISPLITLTTIIIFETLSTYPPDSYHEYTKNGYQVLEEYWYKNNDTILKKWKSKQPLKDNLSHKEREWIPMNTE